MLMPGTLAFGPEWAAVWTTNDGMGGRGLWLPTCAFLSTRTVAAGLKWDSHALLD